APAVVGGRAPRGDGARDVRRGGRGAARRGGLVRGTGAGGIDFTLDQAEAVHHGRQPSLWTITNATHGNMAGELSIRLGLRGPSLCVSDGCASASDAAAHALGLLRSDRPGTPDAAVVVGADAHVRWETLRGMELLRVISTRDFAGSPEAAATASRPFCKTRDGFVLGEGAWAMVLEREDRRVGDGAVLGELMGAAATCDAYHRVRPDPDPGESVRAMRLAIEDAGLSVRDVGTVQLHGTATQVNDALETRAVRAAFADTDADALVCSSIKGAIGHPQGACGLASVVGVLGSMGAHDRDARGAFFPPTINRVEADPACDLDVCAEGARALEASDPRQMTCLINCLAFGAKNSALVVRAAAEGAGG
ncbi:MAG: beta-ketoacyl synthase N-terminal-like domain-containing protein, partial [Planctomycetota bacterium]